MDQIRDDDLLTRIRALEARLGQLNDYYDPEYVMNLSSTKEIENLESYLSKLLVEAQNRGIL